MLKLIKNELIKTFSKITTKVSIVLLILLTIGALFYDKKTSNSIDDWRSYEIQTIHKNTERLKVSEISPQVKKDLNNKILISKYRLKNNIENKQSNQFKKIIQFSGTIEMLLIIGIIIASDLVSGEYDAGTMKLLLIRPHRRRKILLSKFLSLMISIIIFLGFYSLSSYIASGTLFGFSNIFEKDVFINSNGIIRYSNIFLELVKLISLSSFSVLFYSTLSFFISTVLRHNALAVGGGLLLLIVGNSMIEMTSKIHWMKYLPFVNSDMTLHLFGLQSDPTITIFFSVIVLLCYITVLYLASNLIFIKREV